MDLPGMQLWRENLFAILSHNALSAVAFHGLPSDGVMEIGIQVVIQVADVRQHPGGPAAGLLR